MVVSQMWAFAADSFNVKSGQRLFVVIMLGANLGALPAPSSRRWRWRRSRPWDSWSSRPAHSAPRCSSPGLNVPQSRRDARHRDRSPRPVPKLLGGIGLVLRDRYLLHMALFVVLLNWINTTGEFILADYVKADAVARVAESGGTLDLGSLITEFYGNFNFWVTLISLLIQLFLVSRVYHLVGVRGALLVQPVIVALGYGLLVFGPMRRRLHSVLLPDSPDQVCREQRRLLADEHHAAGAIPAGRPRLEIRRQDRDRHILLALWRSHPGGRRVHRAQHTVLATQDFAWVNLVLALAWIALAAVMGRDYSRKAQ